MILNFYCLEAGYECAEVRLVEKYDFFHISVFLKDSDIFLIYPVTFSFSCAFLKQHFCFIKMF